MDNESQPPELSKEEFKSIIKKLMTPTPLQPLAGLFYARWIGLMARILGKVDNKWIEIADQIEKLIDDMLKER